MRAAIALLVAFVASLTAAGADSDRPLRPVTSAWTVEIGSAHEADTYLSPLHYSGWHAGFNYERFQAMRFDPERWVMRLDIGAAVDRTDNPARNASMTGASLRDSWSMMRRFAIPAVSGLRVAAGGITELDAGALILSRNGNNPVSARAAWTVGLTAMATWSTRLGRLPVTLRYQPALPVIGAFFSPDYGELYYEISLGNHSNLAHCAWFGNRFAMSNLVTADLRFGATALRLGYSGRIISSKVNNIVTRSFTHALVIGVSGEWLSLSPVHTPTPETRIISAYY
nr:DUF3316 domain-containing protein [Bacteroides sp.]